jgi:glycosyltransferase domain-containing protein
MSSSLLTLLMPLKGRHLFTLRFLWRANKSLLPYRIVIADGEVHPVIAGLLENAATFPNLDIEYSRYPDDTSFSRFYKKMADAAARIQTPFVMMVDNDDFVIPSGIERCVDFMNAHSDYVSCGGGVAGFTLQENGNSALQNLTGPINRFTYRYSPNYQSRDLAASSLAERVLDGYANYMTTYYNVFRSAAMATICRECAEMNFSDLEVHESYFAMRTLTLGKARSDASCISYLRQYGTSMGSAFQKDWVHHLLRSRLTSDFDCMVNRISSAVAEADGVDPAPIAEEIREIFGKGLRINLARRYSPAPRLGRLKQHAQGLAPLWLRKRLSRRGLAVRREREGLSSSLRADGADETYLTVFRAELAAIEDTLTGAEFIDFVSQHAPGLVGV